jgi:hypothetical protein
MPLGLGRTSGRQPFRVRRKRRRANKQSLMDTIAQSGFHNAQDSKEAKPIREQSSAS